MDVRFCRRRNGKRIPSDDNAERRADKKPPWRSLAAEKWKNRVPFCDFVGVTCALRIWWPGDVMVRPKTGSRFLCASYVLNFKRVRPQHGCRTAECRRKTIRTHANEPKIRRAHVRGGRNERADQTSRGSAEIDYHSVVIYISKDSIVRVLFLVPIFLRFKS